MGKIYRIGGAKRNTWYDQEGYRIDEDIPNTLVQVSDDLGETWTSYTPNGLPSLINGGSPIVFNNRLYIINPSQEFGWQGINNKIHVSEDGGLNWASHAMPNFNGWTYPATQAINLNNKIVLFNVNASGYPVYIESADGINFQQLGTDISMVDKWDLDNFGTVTFDNSFLIIGSNGTDLIFKGTTSSDVHVAGHFSAAIRAMTKAATFRDQIICIQCDYSNLYISNDGINFSRKYLPAAAAESYYSDNPDKFPIYPNLGEVDDHFFYGIGDKLYRTNDLEHWNLISFDDGFNSIYIFEDTPITKIKTKFSSNSEVQIAFEILEAKFIHNLSIGSSSFVYVNIQTSELKFIDQVMDVQSTSQVNVVTISGELFPLQGIVTVKGIPIKNAKIIAIHDAFDSVYQSTTFNDGSFNIPVPLGNYHVFCFYEDQFSNKYASKVNSYQSNVEGG